MKKTKIRILLLLLFLGGLIILPQKAKAAEIIPVNISVKYGQTEARKIFDMINEARTNSEYAWYWNMDDTTKTYCTDLKELKYDYDLERAAMKRATEIALSYDHERPMGGDFGSIYQQENIRYRFAGENIAAGQTTASQVNFDWREDDEPYGGQGHRRNMLSSKFNCVGIGHVYYNGVHYWVEEFAYRPEINTTEVSANDSTETVSVSVDKTKIQKINVEFDQESYSLRIGENTTPAIKEIRIDVTKFWSGGRGLAPVLDTPVISVEDPSTAAYNNNQLSGVKEGTTNLTATLYGITASCSSTVSVHDCKNHWDNGSITQQPTCTEPGEKTFTCSICKNTKTESVSETGHTYASTWTTDIAATCEKTGTESRHCKNKNCTATTDQRSIDALGHIWADNKDGTATCTRSGCEATHTHEWDEGERTTEPTCTEQGTQTFHCTCAKCNGIKTEAIQKLGHKYILTKKDAPTCERSGILHGKCRRCSKTITQKDSKNPALGHSWTDNGDGTATCSREGCGKKHTHVLDSGTISVPPTCTATGDKEYCCTYTNCPYKTTETLVATGHKNKETRNAKKPTCKEEGYTGDIYCKDCGIKLSSGKVTKKFDHDWDSGIVTRKATCTEEGIRTYTCEKCGDTDTINIPKTAHNYIIEQQQKATCTANGYSISVCQNCNDTKRVEIPATGHVNQITKDAKEASCKSEGYTGDVYCQDCNKLLKEGQVIPKTDHVWNKGEVTTSSTCTTEGIKTYTCTSCGITKTEAIAATGHGVTEIRNKKDASVTSEGYTGDIYCTICNQKISSGKRIAKLTQQTVTPGKTVKDKSTNGVYKVLMDGASVEFTKPVYKKSSVRIPDTVKVNGITCKVTAISANAFKNNKSLKSVTIGRNVTVIGTNAFYGCRKLSRVSGGNGIVKIDHRAFANCISLSKITIPGTVRSIGKQAFRNCKKLRSITIKTSTLSGKTIGSKAFAGTYKKPIVKVPAKQLKAYKKLLKARGMSSKAVYRK